MTSTPAPSNSLKSGDYRGYSINITRVETVGTDTYLTPNWDYVRTFINGRYDTGLSRRSTGVPPLRTPRKDASVEEVQACAEAAWKLACAHIDEIEIERKYGPRATVLTGRIDADELADPHLWTPAKISDLKVGDPAVVHGTGYWRLGVVVKVAKTKATVLYTTPSSDGRFFHPSSNEVFVPAGQWDREAEAEVEDATHERRPAGRHEMTAFVMNGYTIEPGADLRGANLAGCNLRYAELSDADLRYAELSGADLRGARLGDAILKGTDLRDADLRGADLGGCDLKGTDLRGADLGGCDLKGTDLRYADLRGANLAGALYDDATVWPFEIRTFMAAHKMSTAPAAATENGEA